MRRAILLASVILLVQLGLVVATHLADRDMGATSRNEKLVSFTPGNIELIRLRDGDGKALDLQRHEDGWYIDGADRLRIAADDRQAEDLLQTLAELKQGLAVATSKEAAERFEVSPENYAYRLVLMEKDRRAAELYFGTSSGFDQMHGRVAGRDEIVTVPMGGHEITPLVEQWIDRDLLKLDAENIVGVDFGELSLARREDGSWQVSSSRDQTDIGTVEARKLVEAVSGLTVHGYHLPKTREEGASDEVMEFTTAAADDRTLQWRIAQKESWYGVSRSDADAVFKVSSWQIEELQKLLEGGKEEDGEGEKEKGPAAKEGIDEGGRQSR